MTLASSIRGRRRLLWWIIILRLYISILPLLTSINQMKNMCALCLVAQLYPTLCDPMNCSPLPPPGFSVHGDSPGKNTGVGCHACPLPGDLPNPGIEPRSLALQADSLPSEPPGKPKNTVVDPRERPGPRI